MKRNLMILIIFTILVKNSIGQITFAPYQTITTGSSPQLIKIVDMNNDGKNDIILGTGFYFDPVNDYTVKIYYQTTPGNYTSPQVLYFTTNGPVRGMDVGDINNDGKKDIAIGNGDNIGLFIQSVIGTFLYTSQYSGQSVDGIKIGDLNSDGKKDIAICHWNSSYIRILYQTTPGNFNGINYSCPNGGYDDIEIGDLNHDGKNDVIYSHGQGQAPYIYVFYQGINSLNSTYINIPCPGSPHSIAIADINNDGLDDMVATLAANMPGSRLLIWTQNSLGLINSVINLPAYEVAEAITTADLNCDGKKEIIIAHGGWLKVSVFESNNLYQFSNYSLYAVPYASHYNPSGIDAGDINSDGKMDVVLADYNSGIVKLLNTTSNGIISYDTISTVSVRYDTMRQKTLTTLYKRWLDITPAYKLFYRDSMYVTPHLVIETVCRDTIFRRKTQQCLTVFYDTLSRKSKCTSDSWNLYDTTHKIFVDSVALHDRCGNIVLYPNPSINQVIIQSYTSLGDVIVYTNDGKLVCRYRTSQKQITLSLGDLPSAMYIIKVASLQCEKKILLLK